MSNAKEQRAVLQQALTAVRIKNGKEQPVASVQAGKPQGLKAPAR